MASFYDYLNELKKRGVIQEWYDHTSASRKPLIDAAKVVKPLVKIDEIKPSGSIKRYVNVQGQQRALMDAQVLVSVILPSKDGLSASKQPVADAVDYLRNAPNFVCGMNAASTDNEPYYQADLSVRSDMTLRILYLS